MSENDANNETHSLKKFLILFTAGVSTVLTGIIILALATTFHGGSLNFGAVIFVGPFPIIIGAGPEATLMIVFGIILAVLSIILFLILRKNFESYVSQ